MESAGSKIISRVPVNCQSETERYLNMSEKTGRDRPEVYALRQEGGDWQISRRDFLKAAGIGAAAVGAGLNSSCSRRNSTWKGPVESLDVLCPQVISHKYIITQLLVTTDGKYLVSNDRHDVKCWDLDSFALVQSYNTNAAQIRVSQISGKNSVIRYFSDPSSATGYIFSYYEIPNEGKHGSNLARASSFKDFAVDSSENIYLVNDTGVRIITRESGYESNEILYSFLASERNPSFTLIRDDKEMFIRMNDGFGILDLETRELKQFEGGCTGYSICMDGSKALIYSGMEYRLAALDSGETVWTRTFADILDSEGNELFVPRRISGGSYIRCKVAVTPDASAGILLGEKAVCLISLTDGSLIRYKLINGDPNDGEGCVAIAKDGTKAAISVSKAILFLSLPDLEILSCPVDLNIVKDDVNGAEVSVKDADTGKKMEYTLPCGAAIPEGGVCTCNCVAGRGGCACNSHGRSNGNGRSNGGASHYWHPN